MVLHWQLGWWELGVQQHLEGSTLTTPALAPETENCTRTSPPFNSKINNSLLDHLQHSRNIFRQWHSFTLCLKVLFFQVLRGEWATNTSLVHLEQSALAFNGPSVFIFQLYLQQVPWEEDMNSCHGLTLVWDKQWAFRYEIWLLKWRCSVPVWNNWQLCTVAEKTKVGSEMSSNLFCLLPSTHNKTLSAFLLWLSPTVFCRPSPAQLILCLES